MNTKENPRFLTEHDARKYAAALSHPAVPKMDPVQFGAVPKFIKGAYFTLNPAWMESAYEVEFVEASAPTENTGVVVMTSQEWLDTHPDYQNIVILFPNGWEDVPDFFDYFNYQKITKSEFNERLSRSILETRA